MTDANSELAGKARFDACMKQADFFSQKVYNRQAYQWKVTIGLWTLLAATIAFLPGKDVPIPLWVGPFVLLAYTFIWVRAVANKNRSDQARAYHFRDLAEDILFPPKAKNVEVVSRVKGRIYRWMEWVFDEYLYLFTVWAHLFEFTITAVLMYLAYHVSSYPGHPQVPPPQCHLQNVGLGRM